MHVSWATERSNSLRIECVKWKQCIKSFPCFKIHYVALSTEAHRPATVAQLRLDKRLGRIEQHTILSSRRQISYNTYIHAVQLYTSFILLTTIIQIKCVSRWGADKINSILLRCVLYTAIQYGGNNVWCVDWQHFTARVTMNSIQRFWSYRAVNTLRHGYRNQSANATYRNNHWLFLRSIQNT